MSLEKLVSDFGTYQKQVAELSKDLRKNFGPLFTNLFEKYPWVEKFSWRQCEPWRDGEDTEFEVLCEPDQIYINDLNSYDDGMYGIEEKQNAYNDFGEAISEIPIEIMKAMFGDSNEVELSRNGDMAVSKYEDG
jgi:hypothetical protein